MKLKALQIFGMIAPLLSLFFVYSFASSDNAQRHKEAYDYLITLAASASRDDHALEFMEKVMNVAPELNLGDVIKLAEIQAAVRQKHLSAIDKLTNGLGDEYFDRDRRVYALERSLTRILTDLIAVSNKVLSMLTQDAYDRVDDPSAQVYFLRLRADCFRYVSKHYKQLVQNGSESFRYAGLADREYKQATGHAARNLDAIDPLRIRVAVNYAILLDSLLMNSTAATNVRKKAFDEAIEGLSKLISRPNDESLQILLAWKRVHGFSDGGILARFDVRRR